jgi:hypothetical protein
MDGLAAELVGRLIAASIKIELISLPLHAWLQFLQQPELCCISGRGVAYTT